MGDKIEKSRFSEKGMLRMKEIGTEYGPGCGGADGSSAAAVGADGAAAAAMRPGSAPLYGPGDPAYFGQCTASLSGRTLSARARKALATACAASGAKAGGLRLFHPERWAVWPEERQLPAGPWPRKPSGSAISAFSRRCRTEKPRGSRRRVPRPCRNPSGKRGSKTAVQSVLLVPVTADHMLYGFFVLYDAVEEKICAGVLELLGGHHGRAGPVRVAAG